MEFQSTSQGYHRAPTINYSMKPVSPVKPVELPEIEKPEVDMRAIGSAVDDMYKSFEKQKAAQAEAKKQAGLNELASKALTVVEKQRQGFIKGSQAETEMRALRMQALQQGFSHEDVHDVFSKYNMGIESMEEARQKKIMENDQSFMNERVNKIRNTYKGLQNKSTTEITNFLEDIDNSQQRTMADMRRLAVLDPNSDDYASVKERVTIDYANNVYSNIVLEISDAVAKDGEITPESIQNYKNMAIKEAVTKYGMTTDMASVAADLAVDNLGLSGNLNRQAEFWKQSTEMKTAISDYLIAHAKGRMMSVQGVPEMMAIDGGRALGEQVTLQSRQTIVNIAQAISSDKLKTNSNGRVIYEASDTIDARNIPDLVRGIQNMNASPIYSPYQRTRLITVTNDALSKDNTPSADDSEEILATKEKNLTNYFNLVNADIQEQEINKIEDPNERERMLGSLYNAKAAALNAKLFRPDVIGSDIRYLNNSGVADKIRIAEDGTVVFAKGSSGLYRDFNADKYADARDKINAKLLKIENPDIRKATAMQQFPAATDLDISEEVDDMLPVEPDKARDSYQSVGNALSALSSREEELTPAENKRRQQLFLKQLKAQQDPIEGAIARLEDSIARVEKIGAKTEPGKLDRDRALIKKARELQGKASVGGSFSLSNPHIVDEGDAADISAADQEQQRVAIETEHMVAKVLVDAIRKAEPDSKEFNELMETLKRVNEKLEYFDQVTYDPYGEGDE